MAEENTFITIFLRVLTLLMSPLISRTLKSTKIRPLKKKYSFRTLQTHQFSPDAPLLNRSRQYYLMTFNIQVRVLQYCGPLTFCFLKIYLWTKFVELHTYIISLRIDFVLAEIKSSWFQTASRLRIYNLRSQFWISSLNVCMKPALGILILCNATFPIRRVKHFC